MRKENRVPNQSQLLTHHDPKRPSKTSKQSFIPKFIVKDTSTISCQDINLIPPREHAILSQFGNSPSYGNTRSNSFRRNWKQDYDRLKRQFKDRQNKFNEVIDVCRKSLIDVHQCAYIDEQSEVVDYAAQERFDFIRQKVEKMLQAFGQFRRPY